jgi:hypothetical protein
VLVVRRVPGTDDFVTVTDSLSPSDFHLYALGQDDAAVYVGESPYHGDFRVTALYGFDGSPATHLITDTGLLLEIRADGCGGGGGGVDKGCFVRDGALGTLLDAEAFVAMDGDGGDTLHAVLGTTAFGSACEDRCRLQRIDVPTRVVEAERSTRFGAGRFVALRHDPVADQVVAGYDLPGASLGSDPYPGHRVASFPRP